MTPEELPTENSPPRSNHETEIEIGSRDIAVGLEGVASQLSSRLARQSESARQSELTQLEQNKLAPKPEYSGLGASQDHLVQDDLVDDVFEDDAAALRWRHALLRLSETFLDAAEERRDLSPILLGALHNALEQLLIHGEEADLMALEDWLSHEGEAATSTSESDGDERRTSDFLMAGENGIYNGEERRVGNDRRSQEERRQADRRS